MPRKMAKNTNVLSQVFFAHQACFIDNSVLNFYNNNLCVEEKKNKSANFSQYPVRCFRLRTVEFPRKSSTHGNISDIKGK